MTTVCACSLIFEQHLCMNIYIYICVCVCVCVCGLGSSVGLAPDNGVGVPASNYGGDQIFRPSSPALGPTKPPVKWALILSRAKVRPGRAADH